jgi:CBS domain-containing protein
MTGVPSHHLIETTGAHDHAPHGIAEVMTRDVITIGPDATFHDVVDCLLGNDISGVPVVGANGTLLGIITEADLITKEAYGDKRPRRHLAMLADHLRGRDHDWVGKASARCGADLMTCPVDTISPSAPIGAAARIMLEKSHKRLPVVEDGRLVGIVARSDLLKPFQRSDDEIAAEVKAVLADPLRCPAATAIKVTVHQGVVTTTGTTRFPSDIDAVRRIIGKVPGVVSVVLALKGRDPEPGPDAPREQHWT